jgi:hypothetical protein
LVFLESDRPSTVSRDRISVACGIGGAHPKLWEPLTKPVYLLGDTQALKAPPSLHSEIEFGSEEEMRVNVASFCFTVL